MIGRRILLLFGVWLSCDLVAAPFAYFPSGSSVAVVDTQVDALVAEPTPLDAYASNVVASPTSNCVYLASQSSKFVQVFDAFTRTPIGHIPLSVARSDALAISPDGTRLYASNLEYLSVIDTSTNTRVQEIHLGPHRFAQGIAVAPDGAKIYVADQYAEALLTIDRASGAITETLMPSGYLTKNVAINHAGTRIYVVNNEPGSLGVGQLWVFDAATLVQLAGPINVGSSPSGIAISPDDTRIYVGAAGAIFDHGLEMGVFAIDAISNSRIASIEIPGYTQGQALSFNPAGTKLYVTASAYRKTGIAAIDVATGTVVATLPMLGDGGLGQFVGPADPASAAACVAPPPPNDIPTLGEWGLFLLALLVAMVGAARMAAGSGKQYP